MNEIESWSKSREKYDWTVDLSNYPLRDAYKDFFNQLITNKNTSEFEEKFRSSLNTNTFAVTGEVCYWKNYGSHTSRDKLTNSLLKLLEDKNNWNEFKSRLIQLSSNPTYKNIEHFRIACGQPNGFATPVTFLSFYNPTLFPMVDKIIGKWWNRNKSNYWKTSASSFLQRSDGWLGLNEQNWNTYLEWTNFCRKYSSLLSLKSGMQWRARDVEIAVWEAEKRDFKLDRLT
ncbi:MAG: hypothetical protein NWE96_00910 [Candidatus Bathyarchaeota archaeon]|nr:hypothetical protein [Candidatus Bathyarchaeota archaeon]